MQSHLDAAVAAVMSVRESLRAAEGRAPVDRIKKDHAADVVTKLDVETKEHIAAALRAYGASVGFAGEELGGKHDGIFWLLDPIDGTGYFVRDIPYCTTMFSLIENGRVILSVICNFIIGELYTAEKGKGTFLNGKAIHVSNRTLQESYIGIEANLHDQKTAEKMFVPAREAVWFHTMSDEYGLIAKGELDGRICLNWFGGNHDYALCALLVAEAGGVVANIGKRTYGYRDHDFIAANPTLFRELIEGPGALFPIP